MNERTRENFAKTHFSRLCRANSKANVSSEAPDPSAVLGRSAQCLRALLRKNYPAPLRPDKTLGVEMMDLHSLV